MWNHNNYSRKFWDNSKCKCDQGKAILDGTEYRVSNIIYRDICIKVHGLWVWGFVCPSVSIVANAFSGDLKTHKSQIFPMTTPQGVAKLSTSPKMTIFPPPLPYYFISDHCRKGDRWTTLFLRNSIVAMDFQSLRTHKTWTFLNGETYVGINLLASTHLHLCWFKY